MPVHLIRDGDTPGRIAGRYGIPERWLYKANDYYDFDDMRPGRRIYIPDYEYDYYDYPKQWGRYKYHDGIRFDLRTGRKRFRPGEKVSIIFSYCNLSDVPRRLRYDDACLYDFKCLRGGRDIWRWSEKNRYERGRRSMLLQPGECRTYRGKWDLCDRVGDHVRHGPYILRAYDRSRELRDHYVDTGLEVLKTNDTIIADGDTCSRSNMLINPGLDNWVDSTTPAGWSAQNVNRATLERSGRYAAEMGTRPGNQALLAQIVGAAPGRSYRIAFWAMENVRGQNSKYTLEVSVHSLDQQSSQIGRVDPVFRPDRLPDNAYRQYSFETGALPAGTRGIQLRFVFRPQSSNRTRVRIDDVELTCIS
ncbi:BsuPI-related putative proteinase inhibitor [Desulfoscipio gibsoniae]|uniref:LysM domain-containing protein n=1 Tax=Desulfoscipio gibsoniae DSM 7213 TaxID=767817 RepID=R4KL07_9FIRM|nr:BsuPI-related putative proteinase inhibitor [Desulfoscipio gibsoniae]AGL03344.1 LysM domain-containing protein [Desulfoscipio gibsoniae DSM 7213]